VQALQQAQAFSGSHPSTLLHRLCTEQLGFESVLAGDHIVLPTDGTTQYPYTATGAFASPADEPFLETLTLLGYLAASTRTIKLGSTVMIVPYRNPVVQAKMFASLDVLSHGRLICGVGVGWLEKEFETLGVPYAARGAMTDEWLAIFKVLWTERDPAYHLPIRRTKSLKAECPGRHEL
jgi:alkanesulfonate monooxygenase SsuD/methylene tetrahydromethanopterin reductase-like flavin-dependent oxidoreductase (luciferase family)